MTIGPDIPPTPVDASGDTSPLLVGPVGSVVPGAVPLRKVVAIMPNPGNAKRKMYLLDCGHTMDRITNHQKKKVACTHCPPRRHSRD